MYENLFPPAIYVYIYIVCYINKEKVLNCSVRTNMDLNLDSVDTELMALGDCHFLLYAIISRVFANGQGDRSLIPGQVTPKTQKSYMMLSYLTLSILRYGSMGKWTNLKQWLILFRSAVFSLSLLFLLTHIAPNFTLKMCIKYHFFCLW